MPGPHCPGPVPGPHVGAGPQSGFQVPSDLQQLGPYGWAGYGPVVNETLLAGWANAVEVPALSPALASEVASAAMATPVIVARLVNMFLTHHLSSNSPPHGHCGRIPSLSLRRSRWRRAFRPRRSQRRTHNCGATRLCACRAANPSAREINSPGVIERRRADVPTHTGPPSWQAGDAAMRLTALRKMPAPGRGNRWPPPA